MSKYRFEDLLTEQLLSLSKVLAEKNPDNQAHGFLGGEFGYGQDFENDTFMMHPFCWCEKEDCPWCSDIGAMPQLAREVLQIRYAESGRAPNFLYKPLDFKVWWYKYIGRGMEWAKDFSQKEVNEIFNKCLESVK